MVDQHIVDSVYRLIAATSKDKADAWLNDFHASGVLRAHHSPICALNHYWRLCLSRLKNVTFAAFVSLDDQFCSETWLSCFEMDIMPIIVRHDVAELY